MEFEADLYQNYTQEQLIDLLKNQVKSTTNLESKTTILQSEKLNLESKTTILENEKLNLESEVTLLENKEQELQSKVNKLQFELEQLRRMIFGSKSERFIASQNQEQLTIPFDTNTEDIADVIALETQQITYEREKTNNKKHTGRIDLPSHLPVNEVILMPLEDVSQMQFIGNEVTDELEYIPSKLIINRYIRPKYITKEDQNQQQEVKIASLDFRPINKCIAGNNLLTQIVIDKYIDHLPIYRQLQRFSREGVAIASSTIESWQNLLAQLLRPLYQVHKHYTINNGYLQVDESPIRVQDKDKIGATHNGFMWVYRAPIPNLVYFEYQKGRAMEFPQNALKEFSGYLQTDGYAGYNQIGQRANVTPLGCWAHARRKFEKALDYNHKQASFVILKIQELYQIEAIAKQEKLSLEEKHHFRLEKSLPILNELGKYIYAQSKLELPRSPLAKAYQYCIDRWDALQNYLKDANLEIDNNNIENAIRPLALGRKNYLFAGSHEAAKNIAMYYSFFGTCKKHDINPQKWLSYVLKNINDTKISNLHLLLPNLIDKDLL